MSQNASAMSERPPDILRDFAGRIVVAVALTLTLLMSLGGSAEARSRRIADVLLDRGPPGSTDLPSQPEQDAAVLANLDPDVRKAIRTVAHRSWALGGVALSVIGMEARHAVAAMPILDSLGLPGMTRNGFTVVDFPSDRAVRGLVNSDDRRAVYFAVRANFVVATSAATTGPSARAAAADLMSRQLDRLVGFPIKMRPGTTSGLPAGAWLALAAVLAGVTALALRPVVNNWRKSMWPADPYDDRRYYDDPDIDRDAEDPAEAGRADGQEDAVVAPVQNDLSDHHLTDG